MAGETFRGTFQIGKETTQGTLVPATRALYVDPAGVLTRVRKPNPHMFMTQTRDNVRAVTVGPVEAGGTVKIPVSSDEIIEPLLMAIRGGVVPTLPTGGTASKQWVFTPSLANPPDFCTMEWYDGARGWAGTGMQVNTFDIAGSVLGQNDITLGLFGLNVLPNTITAALAQRTPVFNEGWETKLYIDAFGATPGTTAIPGQLISWSVKFGNQIARKFTASNTLAASGTPFGALTCTADLVFEAAPGTTLTEYNNWENGSAAPTKRLVRLEFGNNTIIETTIKSRVMVDLPGSWTTVDLSKSDANTRTYSFGYTYVFDPTNAYGVSITAVNMRGAAY